MIVVVKTMIMGRQHSYGDLANGLHLGLSSGSLIARSRLRLFNDIALGAKGKAFGIYLSSPKRRVYPFNM